MTWIWQKEKPQPKTIICNVLGELLLEVNARDLFGTKDLAGKDLSHAMLRGQSLFEADLHNVNLFGADLRGCSFVRADLRDANLAYALIDGADFSEADLDGIDLLHTNVRRAKFDGVIVSERSTIPGWHAVRRRKW